MAILFRAFGLIASFGVLWYLDVWSDFLSIVKDIAAPIFLLVFGLAIFSAWLSSLRWRLIDPDLAKQLSGWDYFRYTMIGASANMFMPGALGGDAIRIALIARDLKSHRGVAVAAIVADRLVGISSIIVLGTLACLVATDLNYRKELLSVLLTIVVLFGIGWTAASNRKLGAILLNAVDRPGVVARTLGAVFRAWQQSIEYYAAYPRRFAGAILICLPIHASWFLIIFVIASNIGVDASFLSLAMVTAISWVIVAIPISFGGVGVRELSFVYLLSMQGIDADKAVVLGTIQSAIFIALAIVGIPFFLVGRRKLAQSEVGDS